MRGDKHIVVPWHNDTKKDQEQTEVCQNESSYHHRIGSKGVKLGVCEAEHNGQNGGADVAQEKWPETRDVPVAIAANDAVQVTSQLIALYMLDRFPHEGRGGEKNIPSRRLDTRID